MRYVLIVLMAACLCVGGCGLFHAIFVSPSSGQGASATAPVPPAKPMTSLWLPYLLGAAAILALPVLAYLGQLPLGIWFGASGAGLIVLLRWVERYTWAPWILLAAGLAYLILKGVLALKFADVVVPAVDASPDAKSLKASVKAALSKPVYPLVKAFVTSVKDKTEKTPASGKDSTSPPSGGGT